MDATLSSAREYVGRKAVATRRSASIVFVIVRPSSFGMVAESLEEQAVGLIANPIEMADTDEDTIKLLKTIPGYVLQFEKVFGNDSVNIDNVGKAIASFERCLVTGPSPYDYAEALRPFKNLSEEDLESLQDESPAAYQRYEQALKTSQKFPMSELASRGRELFFSPKTGCSLCHVGANLTDELYHNLGVGMDQPKPDLGRYEVTKVEKDKGCFKTPTVRNIAHSGPYMHDGSMKTLAEVVEHYAKGGTANPWLSDKIKKIVLSQQEKQDLVDFMGSLHGQVS